MSDLQKRARDAFDKVEHGATRRTRSIMARPVVKWTLAGIGALFLVIVLVSML